MDTLSQLIKSYRILALTSRHLLEALILLIYIHHNLDFIV